MHIQIISESQFYNASFLLGLLLKSDSYGKSYFGHVFGILDFSERIYKFPVNLSFMMHLACWGFLVTCVKNT